MHSTQATPEQLKPIYPGLHRKQADNYHSSFGIPELTAHSLNLNKTF
jgi:hypothetical protein